MKNPINRLLILLAAALVIHAPASCAVIVGNTGGVTNAGGQTENFLLAGGFLSPTVATLLTSVNATFEAGVGSPNITLGLYNDASGVPGTLLNTIDTQTVTAQASYLFTPGSSLALNAATQYWLVASCSNCLSGVTANNWSTHDPITLSGMAGASVTTGIFFKSGSDPWGSLSTRTPIFQVNGDIDNGAGIPEPSSVALVCAGLSLAAWLSRRKSPQTE